MGKHHILLWGSVRNKLFLPQHKSWFVSRMLQGVPKTHLVCPTIHSPPLTQATSLAEVMEKYNFPYTCTLKAFTFWVGEIKFLGCMSRQLISLSLSLWYCHLWPFVDTHPPGSGLIHSFPTTNHQTASVLVSLALYITRTWESRGFTSHHQPIQPSRLFGDQRNVLRVLSTELLHSVL